MMVLGLAEELGLVINKGIDGFSAEHILAQLLIAGLHRLTEGGVLQQSLPHGWRWVVAGTLEAPSLKVVGIGKVAVAVGQVVIPNGSCHEFAASTILM